MNDRAVEMLVRKVFGPGIPFDRTGRFCYVHMDNPSEKLRQERRETFKPEHFFDPKCPHCRPFLKDGAFMVFDQGEVMGVRMLGEGIMESVCLLPQKNAQASYVV